MREVSRRAFDPLTPHMRLFLCLCLCLCPCLCLCVHMLDAVNILYCTRLERF
jgi:hypothetical protein